jgi:hypothetical protein
VQVNFSHKVSVVSTLTPVVKEGAPTSVSPTAIMSIPSSHPISVMFPKF